MLLAINIGNTNISAAVFKGNKIINRFNVPVKSYSKSSFTRKLKINSKVSDVAICSVVPKLTKVLSKDLGVIIKRPVYIIGKNLKVKIKNRYFKPAQLGQDRLVNAYAAYKLYKSYSVVIDAGTAITFDVIAKNKSFLGGLIIPGIETCLKALSANTALLPKVKLQNPGAIISRDTKNSILSGVIYGISYSCLGLVSKIKNYLKKNVIIIGTGGNIRLIQKYSGLKMLIDNNLTLKGINLIYQDAFK